MSGLLQIYYVVVSSVFVTHHRPLPSTVIRFVSGNLESHQCNIYQAPFSCKSKILCLCIRNDSLIVNAVVTS